MEIKLETNCHGRDPKGDRENPVTRSRDLDAVMIEILGQRRKKKITIAFEMELGHCERDWSDSK
jgi:hypothetical protein